MDLEPTRPPIHWVPGAVSLGVKRPGHGADHSPPSSAEVKECVELYLHSPNTPSSRDAQLRKAHGQFYLLPLPYTKIKWKAAIWWLRNINLFSISWNIIVVKLLVYFIRSDVFYMNWFISQIRNCIWLYLRRTEIGVFHSLLSHRPAKRSYIWPSEGRVCYHVKISPNIVICIVDGRYNRPALRYFLFYNKTSRIKVCRRIRDRRWL
jgi:hypothetical protein